MNLPSSIMQVPRHITSPNATIISLLLLQAFQRVRREIPGATLHLVGQERIPRMEGLVNHGFVNQREVLVELMRRAHVLALPSFVDRNPISVLEAMACGTPCVTSNYAAIPEILGDAGIAVSSGNCEELSSALIRVLTDRELSAQLGSAGRRRFETKYNWDVAWEIIRREIIVALGEVI